MGPTLYNLKCTYILLNSWDPWWFNVSFWAGFQDTCPILISLLFYTLYTRGPYIKLNLTKSFCSLKRFFFFSFNYCSRDIECIKLFTCCFSSEENHTLLDGIFHLLSCASCDPQDPYNMTSSVLSFPEIHWIYLLLPLAEYVNVGTASWLENSKFFRKLFIRHLF